MDHHSIAGAKRLGWEYEHLKDQLALREEASIVMLSQRLLFDSFPRYPASRD